MNRFIGILGANATGKSTRMAEFVKQLGEPDSVLDYTFTKDGEDRIVKNAGRRYGDLFVVGRPTKTGKWAGGDYTMGSIGTIACAREFFQYLLDQGIKTVICETYFGCNSTMYDPDRMNQIFDETHLRYFIYDKETPEVFLNRCIGRSGRDLDMDWALNSAGWKDNIAQHRKLRVTSEQSPGTVQRVSIDAPRDWLVYEYKEIISG